MYMHTSFAVHRYYVNDLDIVSRCTIANGPHWESRALKSRRGRRKGEELAGILDERIYAVIFTTSPRQPHRRSPRFKASRARTVVLLTGVIDSRFTADRPKEDPR